MEPIVFKRSIRKTLTGLIGPILFGLVALSLLQRHDLMGSLQESIGFIAPLLCWSGVFLLGFSLLLLLLTLIPGEAYILMDEKGLEMTGLFYSRFYPWSDFESIEVYSRPEIGAWRKWIAFNLRGHPNAFARVCCSFDGLIPDIYDIELLQLHEMLNTWKNRNQAAPP